MNALIEETTYRKILDISKYMPSAQHLQYCCIFVYVVFFYVCVCRNIMSGEEDSEQREFYNGFFLHSDLLGLIIPFLPHALTPDLAFHPPFLLSQPQTACQLSSITVQQPSNIYFHPKSPAF